MPKRGEPIARESLETLYFKQGLSAQEVADRLGFSYHKVSYWMDRYNLKRRDRSEASYLRHNPGGEKFRIDLSNRDLFIAGIALYLGEGRKSQSDLTFTNSDPRILQLWIRFLKQVCNVPAERIKARIDYYHDLDYPSLLSFWFHTLGIPRENFGRPTLKMSRATERSRRRSYGTIHVVFNDSRLKSLMCSWMEDLLEGRL